MWIQTASRHLQAAIAPQGGNSIFQKCQQSYTHAAATKPQLEFWPNKVHFNPVAKPRLLHLLPDVKRRRGYIC